MGILDAIRRLLGRAEDVSNRIDLAVLDAVHKAEDAVDEATGGRFYDTIEEVDERADDVGEHLHLEDHRGEPPAKREDAGGLDPPT
jgi:hypothetical protein